MREKLSYYFDLLFLFVELDVFIWILFELSFPFRPAVLVVGRVVTAALLAELAIKFLLAPSPRAYVRQYWRVFIVAGMLLYAFLAFSRVAPDHRLVFIYSRLFLGVVQVLLFVKFLAQSERLAVLLRGFRVSPAQTIIVAFAFIIFIGSFLLYLPYARPPGEGMRYIDALFTSTSAVCVTGLIVVDTPTAFSPVGHILILLLIQMGGLGIMTIAAFVQVSLGSRMSLYGRFTTASMLDTGDLKNLFAVIRAIVVSTFAFEAAGALLFYPYFLQAHGSAPAALFYSLFHAVSAFCNAGFALYPDSFMWTGQAFYPLAVLMLLIVAGGLGFTVLRNLGRRLALGRQERITVQTRLVVITTVLLLVFGAIGAYLLEREHLLAGLRPHQSFLASLFQSVTARTAGFNTVDTSRLRPITLFLVSILMFIGASPGSTGGGIKTTTFFILSLSIITILRDQRFNTIFQRRIPYAVVNRAFAIAMVSATVVVGGILLLGASESFALHRITFEAFSAFGTVGLSTGITPLLSDFGKIVVMVLMFTGRIGPLTLVLSVKRLQRTRLVTYPEERVMVG
ncbi:MAG: TrkH family potassium uptake protein [Spirochaetota bacterium]